MPKRYSDILRAKQEAKREQKRKHSFVRTWREKGQKDGKGRKY